MFIYTIYIFRKADVVFTQTTILFLNIIYSHPYKSIFNCVEVYSMNTTMLCFSATNLLSEKQGFIIYYEQTIYTNNSHESQQDTW